MKQLADVQLTPSQSEALSELKRRLSDEFDVESVMLYGSVARGEADQESDVDLLVLTSHPRTRFERHKITDVVCEVNLRYDTNFSTLVIDRGSWENGAVSVLPLRDEILKDGILLWATRSGVQK
ncbi:MAG: nucleotidyltransferase domain-containing protein [Planctomycetes bacterium]|nr:nucleotidyltransferase domain-containing protein [Planctomycetota bacterium]MBM4081817.1 nucleotidyltransferase domain-containing protein [Planctomycetota bacterium]MBM4086569.1 nucleotidyltransferase domain-containing protein [Planctomycetota bacterium]